MPQIRMRDTGGILRTVSRIRMRDSGGILRTIQRVRMRDTAGTIRTVWQYMSVALSTYTIFATNAPPTTTTASVTSTVTGGTAPFTYAWEYVSGSLGISASTPTAANTTFTATGPAGTSRVSNFRLKVTDTNGAIAYSPEIIVEIEIL